MLLFTLHLEKTGLLAGVHKDHTTGSLELGTSRLTSKQLILIFAGLFVLNLLLRVFYLRYDFVNGDEAVRALTAVRVLEGARLYVDIVTDKPPGATLFYAAVFELFGRSMVAVHLAATLWNFATAIIVYHLATHLFTRATGLLSASLFIYFSTSYLTPDVMAANTEILLVLPYSASVLVFLRAHQKDSDSTNRRALWKGLFVAGVLTGISTMFKQAAVFNLLFFLMYELVEVFGQYRTGQRSIAPLLRQAAFHVLLIICGLIAALGPVAIWLGSMNAIPEFWQYTVRLGMVYVRYLPEGTWLEFMVSRTLAYVLLNAALWIPAMAVAASAIIYLVRRPAGVRGHPFLTGEVRASLWAAASLCAVFIGGRFFGHYFIQLLPALSLLGGRGVMLLAHQLRVPTHRTSARIAISTLALLFCFTLVRFHSRTAVLAFESITGTHTARSESWGMTIRQREAKVVADRLRGLIEEGEALYIWGYALDVYWQSGCRPATRFLTPYYITGQFQEATVSAYPDDAFWRQTRSQFIDDLDVVRPPLILDVDSTLMRLPYPEIVDWIKREYTREGELGTEAQRPFIVYRLKQE